MAQLPNGQKPGVIAQILLGIAAVGVVIVGFFFLTVALIAGAIIALIIGARLWWTLRKFKREMAKGSPMQSGPRGTSTDALDGEYQVIERESGATKLPPKD